MCFHRKKQQLPYVIFLTGASGTGKSALVEALANENADLPIVHLHFDSIGIPSEEKMIATHGSSKEWQRATTFAWVKKIISEYSDKEVVIFEGQTNLEFIVSAFKAVNHSHYKIVFVHCDLEVRHQRLILF